MGVRAHHIGQGIRAILFLGGKERHVGKRSLDCHGGEEEALRKLILAAAKTRGPTFGAGGDTWAPKQGNSKKTYALEKRRN